MTAGLPDRLQREVLRSRSVPDVDWGADVFRIRRRFRAAVLAVFDWLKRSSSIGNSGLSAAILPSSRFLRRGNTRRVFGQRSASTCSAARCIINNFCINDFLVNDFLGKLAHAAVGGDRALALGQLGERPHLGAAERRFA
jgi:hypothetical protein